MKNKFLNFVNSILRDFVTFVFPNQCLTCNDYLLKNEKLICISCKYNITLFEQNISVYSNNISEKFYGVIPFENAFSFYNFLPKGKIQRLIYYLKYKNLPEIGIFFGRICGTILKEKNVALHDYIIIPIPLHKKKLEKRGYNQSEYFAKGLSEILEIPYNCTTIFRKKNTISQTKMKNKTMRQENIQNAFFLKNKDNIINKKILLVDDVVTTGSTIESCAKILLENKIHSLSIATIAYG